MRTIIRRTFRRTPAPKTEYRRAHEPVGLPPRDYPRDNSRVVHATHRARNRRVWCRRLGDGDSSSELHAGTHLRCRPYDQVLDLASDASGGKHVVEVDPAVDHHLTCHGDELRRLG
jgi:hypothetical protein